MLHAVHLGVKELRVEQEGRWENVGQRQEVSSALLAEF